MQWLHLLCLSLLVLGCILNVHGGNNVLDCCLRTSETPIPRRIVQDYRLQLVQDGCNIPAAVFITTKGKRLCAPLQAPWVIRLQEKLDAISARKVRTIPVLSWEWGQQNPSAPLLPCKLGACNLHIFMGRACSDFDGCFASPARSPLHHHGLAKRGDPLVTTSTMEKRLWGGSCSKDHTHHSLVFHFPRPKPKASSLQRNP
uniref:Chemokine interleukin-8-like domain-containing protein n=1 Tax=Calidris pygmaea TaxID=425635 RepID=A0A8C3KH39_9CHAR